MQRTNTIGISSSAGKLPPIPADRVIRPRDPTSQDMSRALRESGGDEVKFWQKLSKICYEESGVEDNVPAPPSVMLPPGSVVVPAAGPVVRVLDNQPIHVAQEEQLTPRRVVHIKPTRPGVPVSDDDVEKLTKLARKRHGQCTVVIHAPEEKSFIDSCCVM